MFRIRFHGRGGQGMKTASRILGTALFARGYQVQDAPRYGAERRGAPVFAYVRADRRPIDERGIIRRPDLVVVADDTLLPVPAAGVLAGADADTVVLVYTDRSADEWRHRLALNGRLLTLAAHGSEDDRLDRPHVGAACAGAAARLLGSVPLVVLEEALREELAPLGEAPVARSLDVLRAGFDAMAEQTGIVSEGTQPSARCYERPAWVQVPFDEARISAPAIHAAMTSVEVRTGLWRTLRPVVDETRCRRCWWVCSSLCPDSAIERGASGHPVVDYEHCKGCMICVAQCPAHAIDAIPETIAAAGEEASS